MNGTSSDWWRWNFGDLPCHFSSARSEANADLLSSVLSSDFIGSPGYFRSAHLILKLWDSPGPDSYLRLNSLAEDLRLLVGKPAIEAVLRDLKDDQSCEPAWHTVHVAALFERAKPDTVVRFIDARNDVSPDFIVNLEGQEIPVEAKLLTQSEVEASFQDAAETIITTALRILKARPENISLFVIVKDALVPPTEQELSSALQSMPTIGMQVLLKFPHCKLIAERISVDTGMTEQRMIHVLAPLHEREYLRIKTPARHASKQLRAFDVTGGSGILALGLTSQQNPHVVISMLGNQMKQNRYRAIAAALLIKTGTHPQPPRATVADLLEIRVNQFATTPLNLPIALRPLDLAAKLTEAEPPQLDQPAYVRAIAQGRIVDASRGGHLELPTIRRIAAEHLA